MLDAVRNAAVALIICVVIVLGLVALAWSGAYEADDDLDGEWYDDA